MGYTMEEMRAGNELLGLAPSPPFHMPGHGVLPILLDLPFLAAGAALFPDMARGQDLVLSFAPVILTALLVTLLFYWAWRICGNAPAALALALAAGFCTML